jgi:hypothetical protein
MTDIASRSFDHTPIADLPEYHAARAAIDRLATAINRAEIDMTMADYIEATGDMARTSYAADDCECCTGLLKDRPSWPHAAIVEKAWLQGRYRCHRTGRTWTCGWTADLGMIGRMP